MSSAGQKQTGALHFVINLAFIWVDCCGGTHKQHRLTNQCKVKWWHGVKGSIFSPNGTTLDGRRLFKPYHTTLLKNDKDLLLLHPPLITTQLGYIKPHPMFKEKNETELIVSMLFSNHLRQKGAFPVCDQLSYQWSIWFERSSRERQVDEMKWVPFKALPSSFF